MIALIPAFHTSGDKRSGSVQVITPEKSFFIEIPIEEMSITRRPFAIRAGDSTFSCKGLDLNIQSVTVSVTGRLHFGGLRPPAGDIMGPYKFVPFMECRHSVFSLTHTVKGSLMINGELLNFSDGIGYMEGDRGRSFPKRYVWTQCNWSGDDRTDVKRTDAETCSLMLSAAEVNPLGSEFIGIIGFVYFRGREIRIASYCGAKAVSVGSGTITVRQGAYILTAQLLDNINHPLRAQPLRAPSSGEMVRLIKESLSCRARYTMTESNNVLFDFISDHASFEYEF